MADLISTLSYAVDLDNGTKRLKLDRTLICGDNALAVGITLTRGGERVDLTGMTAMLWAVRADGASVFKTAATSGNTATAQLHTQGTAVPGKLAILFCVTDTEDHTVTPLVLDAYVFSGETDAVVDAGDILPSLSELLAQIDACNTAAENATNAASTANASASAADTAAGNAQDAADAITDITAEAGTLAAGSEASAFAEEDPEDGHINLVLGIPRGDKGERGSLPWYGTAITGNSSEPAAYATGLALVNAGDTYIYTGVDSENAGNEYECTLGGNPATALWIYRRNSRGVPGAGNVSYVDGVAADVNGNVALNAAKKVSGATLDNFAALTATGDLTDSGHKHSDYATSEQGEKADNAVSFSVDQSTRTDAEKARARGNILAASVQELLEKTGYGIYSGLKVTAQATPNMTVTIPVGIAYLPDGTRVTPAAVASQAINAADATNGRIDIVYVSIVGAVSYLAGMAAASPEAPAVPSGGLLIAEIMVGAGVTTITDDDISYDNVRYIGDSFGPDLLWETAVPGSAGAFEFVHDLSKYRAVRIDYDIAATSSYHSVETTEIPVGVETCINGSYYRNATRSVVVSKTGVTFSTGYYFSSYGNMDSDTASSTVMVPLRIWGVL